MKVALLYPAWTSAYSGLVGHFARRNSVWPPLNLACLAAIAEQEGHEVVIVDGEAEKLSVAAMVKRVQQFDPGVIGLTSFTPFFHLNVALATALKAAGVRAPIAVGGPHARIMGEKALLPPIDYVFIGEAERSWVEFLHCLDEGGRRPNVSGVKGLWYRSKHDGAVRTTGQPVPLSDPEGKGFPLDQFPMPARHLLPMHRYKLGTLRGRLPMTSIQASRGCFWRCIFCASEKLLTTRVVRRSPASIVDEIESVVEAFNVRHFFFVDDVLTFQSKYILEIADRLIQTKMGITFEGGTRANLVDEAIVQKLAEAGLIRLSFGLETVDSEMRKTMKKKVPLDYYEKANRLCNKYGIEAMNSVMIGLPGETRETVRKTMVWLRGAKDLKQANLSVAIPYPGTEFHDIAVEGSHGVSLLTQDFSQYRRYGSAVTKVGDLTPEDLEELQNEGFVSIYSAPWRWLPMLRKQGIIGFVLTFLRIGRMLTYRLRLRFRRSAAGG